MTQLIFKSLSDATERAINLSKEVGYAAIIFSRGNYYVESEPPMVRVFESLEAEYKNGNILSKS